MLLAEIDCEHETISNMTTNKQVYLLFKIGKKLGNERIKSIHRGCFYAAIISRIYQITDERISKIWITP